MRNTEKCPRCGVNHDSVGAVAQMVIIVMKAAAANGASAGEVICGIGAAIAHTTPPGAEGEAQLEQVFEYIRSQHNFLTTDAEDRDAENDGHNRMAEDIEIVH
jgi:hypothetical protein